MLTYETRSMHWRVNRQYGLYGNIYSTIEYTSTWWIIESVHVKTVCVLCSRFDLYLKMVSEGLEQLEEQHKEKSEVQSTRDAAADAAEIGKYSLIGRGCCVVTSRIRGRGGL